MFSTSCFYHDIIDEHCQLAPPSRETINLYKITHTSPESSSSINRVIVRHTLLAEPRRQQSSGATAPSSVTVNRGDGGHFPEIWGDEYIQARGNHFSTGGSRSNITARYQFFDPQSQILGGRLTPDTGFPRP